MKITIVGGGSYAWAPNLIQDFLHEEFLSESEMCLMDINEVSLNEIFDYSQLCKKSFPKTELKFTKTTDLREALSDASFVIVAISNGGLKAELEDHRIARRHGFYNMKGSEVGIAGCSRTLRHVPEMVRIAREMEKYCPDALLLNVTNPLSANTRSVNKYTKIKSVGFCHGVCNHLEALFPLFDCEGWNGIEFNVAGVDHCSWLLNVKYKGKDALQIIKEKGFIEAAYRGQNFATFDDRFAGTENLRLRFIIWDIIGYMPAITDEHCVEFFGQIMKSSETREFYNITYDRIAERTKTVNEGRDVVKDVLEGKEKLRISTSGEIIAKFIAALNGAGAFSDVLNYPNEGQIPNLPLGTIVETMCTIDSNGIHPIHTGGLPPILESIVGPVAIREELYMESAIEDNIQKLRSALVTDPLVNEFRNIDVICSELMNYNRQFRKI